MEFSFWRALPYTSFWRRVNFVSRALLLAGAAMLGGCTDFQETHYFRQQLGSQQASGPEDYNYFRLSVSGSTSLTSARFVSGYFDPAAVDQYFSEFSTANQNVSTPPADGAQPADGTAGTPATGSPTTKKDPPNPVTPIAAGNQGKKLVMILSTNSDAVANGINSLANNQALLVSVAQLTHKAEYQQVADSQAQADSEDVRQKAVALAVTEKLVQLKAAASTAEAQPLLLDTLNLVAFNLGNRSTFASVADAEKWLRDHRLEFSQ